MDQMNISITDQLASYVRKKVKSGRYNNASEVFREAIRRMEQEEQRELRLAKPSVEDILADLTEQQIDDIRERVRASIASIEAGDFFEYETRQELKEFMNAVKERGRKRLRQKGAPQ